MVTQAHTVSLWVFVSPVTQQIDVMLGLQSRKRGLSLDEKRGKILEIFHESSDVFQLKVRGPRSFSSASCPTSQTSKQWCRTLRNQHRSGEWCNRQ